MTLYGTGVRRAELTNFKIAGIDSQPMVIHVQVGSGNFIVTTRVEPRIARLAVRCLHDRCPQFLLQP
jgi:hypothetical protein